MLDAISILVLTVALVIASIHDIRTREVPDWLSFSLITIGLGLSIIRSVIDASYHPAIASIIGLGAGFLVGVIMFYAGQWGGGDSKLIMGIGAIMGLHIFTAVNIIELPLFVMFLLNIIIVGSVYGLFWALYMLIRHWKIFKTTFTKRIHDKKVIPYRITTLVLVLVSLATAIIVEYQVFKILFSLVAISIFILFYLYHVIKSLEDSCMIKRVPVSKLTEGDWIAEEIKHKKEVIAGPKDLGISKEQIELLKKHNTKTVLIKEGIPFVPSFLGAYILLLAGNWLIIFF